MTERQKQTHFFRELMRTLDCEKCRELQIRITKSEREDRCIRSALGWAFLLALFSLAGLGYSAVLLPEFFNNSRPMSVHIFSVLLTGSLISAVGFSCFWCWHRRLCNGLHQECRNLIVALQKAKLPAVPEFVRAPSVASIPAPSFEKEGVVTSGTPH